MSCFQTVEVAVDSFRYSITGVGIHFVGYSQHAAYCNCRAISSLIVISIGGNIYFGVERIFFNQSVCFIRSNRQQNYVVLSSDILNSCGRMASGYESNVNVAVFQCAGSFSEGKILNVDIVIGNTINSQNLTGVSFGTGTRCAYRNAFAFNAGKVGNAAFGKGYNLNGFRIESCKAIKVGNFLSLNISVPFTA